MTSKLIVTCFLLLCACTTNKLGNNKALSTTLTIVNKNNITQENINKKNSETRDMSTALKIAEDANKLCNSGKYDQSISMLSNAIDKHPTMLSLYSRRARCFSKAGRHSQSVEDRTKIINLSEHPDSLDYALRAYELLEMNDYNNAIIDFDRAIQLNPSDYELYRNRGDANFINHNCKRAIVDYNKYIKFVNNDARIFSNRADCREKLEDYEGALEDYKKTLSLDKDYWTGYCGLGSVYYSQQNYNLAVDHLEKCKDYAFKNNSIDMYESTSKFLNSVNKLKNLESNK
jgi:tetratricopeptide (TPR) repeat protein